MIEVLAQSAPPPTNATPVAQLWFVLLGLTIACIVLVAGLLAMASLRRTRRSASPTRTTPFDAWAESGRRATPDPSASDILDGDAPEGGGRDG